eukprot:CAMPEP_0119009758 /NCGR_PEP_ID=MMETSP1176-20130426/4587_1 /TAXON_ID=265551 /ORGANISM="Synedropsis recta cf, Strain CCMP1620" /LENGTH=95 /DNA_ID=CAMNT_0006962331 /DNA_START=37 /DNA_END=321 /DNA_ORIENTATION=-
MTDRATTKELLPAALAQYDCSVIFSKNTTAGKSQASNTARLRAEASSRIWRLYETLGKGLWRQMQEIDLAMDPERRQAWLDRLLNSVGSLRLPRT